MRYLAAVDTVHTAAALCDYLGDHVGPEDEVVVLAVHEEETQTGDAGEESDDAERDRREALNVAKVRLAAPAVETLERRGTPAAEILAVAEDRSVDELLLGIRTGSAESADCVGSTTRAVLDGADRPILVLPDTGP